MNNSRPESRALTALEYKVLSFLLQNGAEFSEKEIARQLHLSPSTVNYVLHKLRAEDIVRGFYYRFNYFKLGLERSAGLYFTVEQGADMMDCAAELAEYPGVEDAVVITGRYDVALKVYQPTLEHIQDLNARMGRDFRGRMKFSSSAVTIRPYKIHQIPITAAHLGKTELSELDRKLIGARSLNPQIAITDLADQLGVSRNTASAHWHDLIERKVVLKKSVLLNPSYAPQLGLDFRTIVMMDVRPDLVDEICPLLAERPEVHELATVASNYNVISVVRTHSVDEFQNFHLMLRRVEPFKGNVVKTNSVLVVASKSRRPSGIDFHESTLGMAESHGH